MVLCHEQEYARLSMQNQRMRRTKQTRPTDFITF